MSIYLLELMPEKRSLRIFCAEDNTILGEIMVRLFTQAGHTVEHAADGLEAWERLSEDVGRFDLLVTDNQMPGLNGLELVELLRQANYRGRIIVHSSSLTPRETESYRVLGVDSIVLKTTPAEVLLGLVKAFAES